MVQGYRIAKGAHHNRTNFSHFNLKTKTDRVFATFGVDKSNRMECPEHCSGEQLVVVPFRYINATPYQLYLSEHAKETSHSFKYHYR
jgi:hypothetical protein